MGLRTTQLLGTFFDGVTRHTEEAYRWAGAFGERPKSREGGPSGPRKS